MSLYAKVVGFRVVATDIAARAITVRRALIENTRMGLSREDVLQSPGGSDLIQADPTAGPRVGS